MQYQLAAVVAVDSSDSGSKCIVVVVTYIHVLHSIDSDIVIC